MGVDRPIRLCSCNGTVTADPAAITTALGGVAAVSRITWHRELCRGEVGAVETACRAGDVTIACTQATRLFGEVAEEVGGTLPTTFNVREFAGWSAEGAQSGAKIAALIAAATLPDPEPVSSVTMHSGGHLLIVGEAAAAIGWADRLHPQTAVTVLITGASSGSELPMTTHYDIVSGTRPQLSGHLGTFDLAWTQNNPIDLDLCVRCNACIRACPEQAIGFDYQVDGERCRAHRACVTACGSIGAIDFARRQTARDGRFDLVLDLSPEPLLHRVEPPTGYAAPGRDPLDQALAVQTLLALTGDFEKPRYVAFNEKKCAHSRAGQPGCSNCIDACATAAIRSAGESIIVDNYLCQGCGTCATVCPSGALAYQYPRVVDLGGRIKTLLHTYHAAGGENALLLLHSAEAGRQAIERLARHGKGLPARVLPVETWSADSVGIDLLLGAVALGAVQVAVLAAGSHDPTALARQAGVAQTILNALGYAGEHFRIITAETPAQLQEALWDWPPASGVAPAPFRLLAEKRTTLEFAIEHLARHAPTPAVEIPLPAGAPFGTIGVSDACTLCNACASVCPPNAITAAADAPRLDFLEAQCVQCGLCANSCPEGAITLTPRLLIDGAKQRRVLREAEIFNCTRCGKPIGARSLIEGMLVKLAGHSMFATDTERARLSMCADCRVIDLMQHEKSTHAWEMDR